MTPPRVFGIRRWNALLKGASEPVFLLDSTRRIVYANAAWEALTGRSADAVMGLPCLPGSGSDGDLAGLAASLSPPPEALAGHPAGGATLIVRADGERLWRRIEFWPFHDARGTLQGLFALIRETQARPHAPESESQHLRAELQELRDRLRDRHGSDAIIGRGPAHQRLMRQIVAAAGSGTPTLIVGEPGTGRRLVARTIHRLTAAGPSAPFLAYDCAALPPELLERELFGDEGASRPPIADGTTWLLIDVVELPRDLQARLAAENDPRVRLLATTSTDPDSARLGGRLRDDLYYLLTPLILRLPPLRERPGDLPLLAQHLLDLANRRGTRRRAGFDPGALAALAAYDWPGNIRELARVVDAAHERAAGDLIVAADLPAGIRGQLGGAYTPPPMPPPVTPLDDLLTRLERRLIEQALRRARHNKSRAAELLDISRPRLYRRIKELNIPDVPDPDDPPPLPAPHANGHTTPTPE